MNAVVQPAARRATLAAFLQEAGAVEVPALAHQLTIAENMWPPFNHQITGLNQTLCNARFGLFDEPGCGKTFPAQAWALYLIGYGNKIVGLMPPVLLTQFVRSLHDTFIGSDQLVHAHILNQEPAKREELYAEWDETGWPDLLLMSYQMFTNYPSEMRINPKKNSRFTHVPPGFHLFGGSPAPQPKLKLRKTKVRTGPETYRTVKDRGYECLLADESHMLKEPGSMFHRSVAFFAGALPSRQSESKTALLLMTGTPIPNVLKDAYGSIKLLRPYQYGSLKSFERLHCIYQRGEDDFDKLIGYQNKDMLNIALYASARRVIKDDVFDMKTPRIIEAEVELTERHMRLYKKLVKERFLEVDGQIIDALQAQSLRQKCLQIVSTPQHFGLKDLKENAVLAEVGQLLDSIGLANEKVLLFSHFKRTTEFFADYYKQYNPAVIYSGTQGSTSKQADKFKYDDTCRLCFAQPDSGGVGLNFQEVCAYVIFIEPLSVPGKFKQASERVHRPGQKKQVVFYIVKALGTSSPKLTAQMLEKEQHTKDVTQDRTSLLDQLMGAV